MRKLIRRWLGLDDPPDRDAHDRHTAARGIYPTYAPTEGRAPTALVQRINNGFLVVHNDNVVYCENAEGIAGVAVSMFTANKLGAQYELSLSSGLITGGSIPTYPARPLNQPHV